MHIWTLVCIRCSIAGNKLAQASVMRSAVPTERFHTPAFWDSPQNINHWSQVRWMWSLLFETTILHYLFPNSSTWYSISNDVFCAIILEPYIPELKQPLNWVSRVLRSEENLSIMFLLTCPDKILGRSACHCKFHVKH